MTDSEKHTSLPKHDVMFCRCKKKFYSNFFFRDDEEEEEEEGSASAASPPELSRDRIDNTTFSS